MTKHKLNILLPLLLTAVFFAALLIIVGNNSKKVSFQPTPSPTAVNNKDEKIENGVYTNYKYGFSFEYPTEIFDIVDRPWQEPNIDKMFYVDGQRFPGLSVGIDDYPTNIRYYSDRFEKCMNIASGGVVGGSLKTTGVAKKLYDTEIACVMQSFPGEKSDEITYSYNALIKSPKNEIFYLALSEGDLYDLQILKDEFDASVKSFKFIVPEK